MEKEWQGVIAQLGERLNGIQEVGGSIPPGSTNIPPVLWKDASPATPASPSATKRLCLADLGVVVASGPENAQLRLGTRSPGGDRW